MEMMTAFTLYVGPILASPLPLFVICVLSTQVCFAYMEKLAERTLISPVLPGLLAGLFNGALALALTARDHDLLGLSILLPPLLVVLEFALISRDKVHTYLGTYLMFQMDFACLYAVALSIIKIWPVELWTPEQSGARRLIFFSGGLLMMLLMLHMRFSKSFPNREISTLLHSLEEGKLLYFYLISGDFVLLLSYFSVVTKIRDTKYTQDVEAAIFFELLLLVSLILFGCYLIIVVQGRQVQMAEHGNKLDHDLQTERLFRRVSQKDVIFSYRVNITRDIIEEGEECFSEELRSRSANYTKMMDIFSRECVHPEDQAKIFQVIQPDYIRERLMGIPSYTLQFRLSPERVMKLMNLPDEIDVRMRNARKEWLWVEIRCTVVRELSMGDVLVYVAVTDIDEQMTETASLRKAASIDSLTNLYNRVAMEDRIHTFLKSGGSSGALLIVDLDNFKLVNDNLGHPAGDRLLRETASMLRAVFRDVDIVGRLGGDEFCIFVVGLHDRGMIEQRVLEMRERGWRVMAKKNGEQFQTSLSIGIALCPECGTDYETLYGRADVALYRAKEAGRNTYRFAEPD